MCGGFIREKLRKELGNIQGNPREVAIHKLRHTIRSLVEDCPLIYLSLCRLRIKTRHITLSKDTELVIEGFPRSANTFAVAAFTLAQQRPVPIARHLHAPAQVIAAVRRGIPTLVLIRRPKDAVLSLVIRAPHISVEQALKDYIHFYKSIVPYREGYVIARFDEVTQDFGRVIESVNDRFGTSFEVFNHSEDNVRQTFKIVEQMDKEDMKVAQVRERTVARPSKDREALKASHEKEFESLPARDLLLKAENTYDQFVTADGSSKARDHRLTT